jgi:glycosyltransferase involved in cell wall biosynthesis
MKVNIISETESLNLGVSGVTTSIKNIIRVLKRYRIDYVINGEVDDDSSICHFHTVGFGSFTKLLKCKKPKVVSAHAIPEEMKAYAFYPLSKYAAQFYLPLFYNQADLVIAPSEFTKKELRGMKVKNRVEVISNGVDTKKFSFSKTKRKRFRRRYGYKEDDFVVYSVGFIMLRKGLKTFLELARRFPEFKFFWVGRYTLEGTDFPILLENNPLKVRSMVRRAPKNVVFTGFVDDIVAAHSAGDVFLFPSYAENEGVSILEAGSCSRPVVVRDIGTYQGWLFNNRNCLKFRTDKSLHKKIKKLAGDSKLRRRLGAQSRKAALKKDLFKTGKKLVSVYKSLV